MGPSGGAAAAAALAAALIGAGCGGRPGAPRIDGATGGGAGTDAALAPDRGGGDGGGAGGGGPPDAPERAGAEAGARLDGGAPADGAGAGGADAGVAADLGGEGDAPGESDAAADGGAGGPRDAIGDGPSPILPVILIEVRGLPIGETDKTPGMLRVVTAHDGTLEGIAMKDPSLASPIGIELRGAGADPKRSYAFELRDGLGSDRPLPFLGMPTESDWVLDACYSDKTCLRNALGYALAQDLGRWAPRTRFAEVFVDGQYQGLYVVTERIKENRNRVDIPKPAQSSFLGDVSGGYIFKMEGGGEGRPTDPIPRDWVSAPGQRVYAYHFPKYDRIVPVQKLYLHGFVAGFENAMKSASWSSSYAAQIDLGAWVDYALVEELANNTDGYFKSAYFVKLAANKGGRLQAGPVWDFDGAFGNADRRDGWKTDVWAHQMNRFGAAPSPYDPPGQVTYVPFYWEKLWTDGVFRAGLRCRWQELRRGPWALERIEARIAAFRQEIALAQPRDQAKWKTIGVKLRGNTFVGASYDEEVAWLRDFVDKRLAWLDAELAQIPGACPSLDAGAPADAGGGAGDAPAAGAEAGGDVADARASGDAALDAASRGDAVVATPGADAVDATPGADAVDATPGGDADARPAADAGTGA